MSGRDYNDDHLKNHASTYGGSEDSLNGDSHNYELVDDGGPPPDRGNLCYYIFFLQGVGSLFPWNAFISADFYFQSRLEGTEFEGSFGNYFTAAFQLANTGCLYLASRYQHRWSQNSRVTGPLSASFLGFLITVIGTQIKSLKGNNFFFMNVALMIFIGGSTAFLGGGLFGLAGGLPPRYTQALMGGQGLGGVGVAVLLIASISAEDSAALLFFGVSLVIILMCILSYRVLLRLPIMIYFNKKKEAAGGGSDSSEKAPLLMKKMQRKRSYLISNRGILDTYKDVCSLALGVMANFAITLSVFPSLLVKVQTSYESQRTLEYYENYFTPIFCFLGFNLSDLIGRTIAGMVQWPTKPGNLNLLIGLRALFIPVFIFSCMNTSEHWNRPEWMSNTFIAQDPILYVMMLLFGVTNGYYGSLAMMYGPPLALPEEREVAGAIMIFFLTLGVTLGTILSFGTLAIACMCNPFVTYPDGGNSPHFLNTTTPPNTMHTTARFSF